MEKGKRKGLERVWRERWILFPHKVLVEPVGLLYLETNALNWSEFFWGSVDNEAAVCVLIGRQYSSRAWWRWHGYARFKVIQDFVKGQESIARGRHLCQCVCECLMVLIQAPWRLSKTTTKYSKDQGKERLMSFTDSNCVVCPGNKLKMLQ